MSSRSQIVERLNVEKANDGRAGMTICGGIFIATNCHVIILVMSGIFMVAGSLLTAISYRPRGFGEELHNFIIRQVCAFTCHLYQYVTDKNKIDLNRILCMDVI